MTGRGPLLPTLISGATALGLRIAHGLGSEAPFPVLDQARFLAQAAAIRAGSSPGEGAYQTSPLYPYLLAVLGDGARWTQLLLGVGTAALVALATTRRFGHLSGLLAGMAVAVSGPSIHYEGMLLVAGPMAFLLALALALEPDEDGPREGLRGGVAGVALGLAAALRPTALVPALALLVVTLARGRRRAAATLGLGLVAAVLPFTLRNATLGGEPVLLTTGGGFNLWVGNHPGAPGVFEAPPGYNFALDPAGVELARRRSEKDLSPAEASTWWRNLALDGMDPGLFTRKLALFFHPQEIPQLGPDDFRPARARYWWLRLSPDMRWLLLLALLAPLACRENSSRLAAPLAMGLGYGVVVILFFVSGRFRLPLLPVAAMLAGAALGAIPRWPRPILKRPEAWFGLALAALSLLLYRPGGPYTLGEGQTPDSRARELASSGRHLEAADAFRELLSLNPTHARAGLGLGQLLMGPLLGEDQARKQAAWTEAEQVLSLTVTHQPSLGEAWFYLGVARLNLGRREPASTALEAALRYGSPADEWRSEAQRALEAARR